MEEKQLEQINQQIKELVGLYRGAVSHCGISENEFWIWYALVNMEGEFSQQDLCGLWSLSKQTVNTIINHMAQKGYLTLELIPGTRNRKRIRMTPEGLAHGRQLVTPMHLAEQRALDRMDPEEIRRCITVLGNFIRIFKEELYDNEQL